MKKDVFFRKSAAIMLLLVLLVLGAAGCGGCREEESPAETEGRMTPVGTSGADYLYNDSEIDGYGESWQTPPVSWDENDEIAEVQKQVWDIYYQTGRFDTEEQKLLHEEADHIRGYRTDASGE